MQEIDVYSLPSLVDESRLAGATAVVIDVLRATTSLIAALNAGAAEMVPLLEIDETRRLKSALENVRSPGSVVAGGERHGVPIEGFDFGNSPQSFTPERISGRTLLFTTTNGTVAMHAVRSADRVILAGFVNAQAVVDRLCNRPGDRQRIVIVCAGTDGEETEEDLLLAGCLVSRSVEGLKPHAPVLNDTACRVRNLWDDSQDRSLIGMLRESRGGRNLVDLGLDADIEAAAAIDSVTTVPILDPATMRIFQGKVREITA